MLKRKTKQSTTTTNKQKNLPQGATKTWRGRCSGLLLKESHATANVSLQAHLQKLSAATLSYFLWSKQMQKLQGQNKTESHNAKAKVTTQQK